VGVKSGEDLITWARLAVNNSIAYNKVPLATFVLDPAHSYGDKPNRVPQEPDVVGNALKNLNQSQKSINGFQNYLAHWHKMRASIYLRLGKRKPSLKEILISLKYVFLQPKVWMYGLFLLLPTSIVNRIFKLKS
jgi:hypothetical protein